MGPVESVSAGGDLAHLTVAGQTFNVSASAAQDFAIGDYVVVASTGADSPSFAYHIGLPYVPGVSAVRIKGVIRSVDVALGRLSVGNITLDYTPQLAVFPSLTPAAGNIVEAIGVQPAPKGIIVADTCAAGVLLERR